MLRKLLGVYATNEVVNEAYSRFFSSSKPISEDQLNPVRYLAVGNGIIDLEEFRFSDPKGHYFTSWLDVDVERNAKIRGLSGVFHEFDAVVDGKIGVIVVGGYRLRTPSGSH
jgi:hypothetical protein